MNRPYAGSSSGGEAIRSDETHESKVLLQIFHFLFRIPLSGEVDQEDREKPLWPG